MTDTRCCTATDPDHHTDDCPTLPYMPPPLRCAYVVRSMEDWVDHRFVPPEGREYDEWDATLDAARASRPEPGADLAGLLREAMCSPFPDGPHFEDNPHEPGACISQTYAKEVAARLAARGVTVSPDLAARTKAAYLNLVTDWAAVMDFLGLAGDSTAPDVIAHLREHAAKLAALPASPAPQDDPVMVGLHRLNERHGYLPASPDLVHDGRHGPYEVVRDCPMCFTDPLSPARRHRPVCANDDQPWPCPHVEALTDAGVLPASPEDGLASLREQFVASNPPAVVARIAVWRLLGGDDDTHPWRNAE